MSGEQDKPMFEPQRIWAWGDADCGGFSWELPDRVNAEVQLLPATEAAEYELEFRQMTRSLLNLLMHTWADEHPSEEDIERIRALLAPWL